VSRANGEAFAETIDLVKQTLAEQAPLSVDPAFARALFHTNERGLVGKALKSPVLQWHDEASLGVNGPGQENVVRLGLLPAVDNGDTVAKRLAVSYVARLQEP
jgi:hypothetical protein